MISACDGLQQPPFVIKDPESPKGFKGYCIDLIDEIAKLVNFEYVIQEVEDKKIGKMDENGEWNGLIRKLIDKKADIALGAMSVMVRFIELDLREMSLKFCCLFPF